MKNILVPLLLCILSLPGCKDKKSQAALPDSSEQEVSGTATPKGPMPEVHPISHASAVLMWEGTTVYIDPVGGAEAYGDFPEPDLILITDIHGDHFNLETLQEMPTSKAKIIAPQAVADQMPEAFVPQLDVLDNGSEKERLGIVIKAIPMYNLRPEARQFHEKGRGNGYVLERQGLRVYFSGDTEDIPEMRSLKDIDMAFICMNLPYTMPVEQAADAVLDFKPAAVYPYHYRGNPDVSDVARFAELVSTGDANIEIVQLDWYPKAPY